MILTKSFSVMNFVVNLQAMAIMTILVLTYLASSKNSLNDHNNIKAKFYIGINLVFQSSVALINCSFIVQPLNMMIMRSIALIFLFFCFVIIKFYVFRFFDILDDDALRILPKKFEISIKDQELGVYLTATIVCIGGYIIYTLLLISGVDDDLALLFLILVQIISVMPVMYLESRIAKRLVFQLQVK